MPNLTEEWRDVPNYDGKYQVSNIGNVRNTNHRGTSKTVIVPQGVNRYGYYSLRLTKGSVSKTKEVHQIVAVVFLNHKPCGTVRVVNHIDENKKNNNVDNLEIVTQRQNSSLVRDHYSSKYVGVHLHKKSGKWLARIQINKKSYHLGCFDCEMKASEAYQTRLREHLKEVNDA
jgi:hypothetical protein